MYSTDVCQCYSLTSNCIFITIVFGCYTSNINVVLQDNLRLDINTKPQTLVTKPIIVILCTTQCLILDGFSKTGRSGLVRSTVRTAVRHLSAAALDRFKYF